MFDKYKTSQPIVCKILKKVVISNNYSHAYLFETNGYEKGFELAKEFAKMLLCPSQNKENINCQKCYQCQTIDDNNFAELKIVNPDGSWIKKEQLNELQEEFSKKALLGNKKIYLINQADKLNTSTANSILKFLEEPQDGIIAILITENRYQLLDTIISRCQIVNFKTPDMLVNESKTLNKIGQLIINDKNDLKTFLTDEKSLIKLEKIINFADYFEKYGSKLIIYTNNYWFSTFNDKILTQQGIIMLLYLYKDILNIKIGQPVDIFNDYVNSLKIIANSNTVNGLVKKIDIINIARQNIEYNANINLLIDKLILEMEGVTK